MSADKEGSDIPVIQRLARVISARQREVAGPVLTRQFMDEEVERPLRRELQGQIEQGTIRGYELVVDKDSSKRAQGICDVSLRVAPAGSAEYLDVSTDVPELKPEGAESGSGDGSGG